MKKILFQLLVFLFFHQTTKTQTFGGNGFQTFKGNHLSIPVCSNGKLFNNLTNSNEGFTYRPFGPGSTGNPRALGWMCGLWLGGKDANQNLRLFAPSYNTNGAIENSPGPFSTNANSAFYSRYDRLWNIRKAQIDSHLTFYSSSGYITPEVILNWPGNGNTQNGEAAKLAPFLDFNNNGQYEPQLGDAPIIKGDEAIFFMYNDKFPHEESGGLPINAEIHGMLYVFKTTQNEDFKRTAFLNYEIFNRSTTNYSDFYASVFFDADLGNFNDDYIGCDSTRSLGYFYNGDADDETSTGFGINPPALGIKTLGCPMYGFHGFGSTGFSNDFQADNYYNLMKGLQSDGTPFIYGESILPNGYPTKFEYSDSPNLIGWSEAELGNESGERRIVASLGQSDFLVGQSLSLNIAFFMTAPNLDGGQLASVERAFTLSDNIDAFINAMPSWEYDCKIGIENISEIDILQATISPNPSNSIVNFSTNRNQNQNVTIELFDLSGRKIDQLKGVGNETISWNKGNLAAQIILARISVDSKHSKTYKIVLY